MTELTGDVRGKEIKMSQRRMVVCSRRFYLHNPQTYMIYGIIPEDGEIEAFLDREPLHTEVADRIPHSAIERYNQGEALAGRRVELLFHLPADLKKYHLLSVYGKVKGARSLWYRIWVRELVKEQNLPQYHIEEERIDRENGIVSVRGWAAADQPLRIRVYNDRKQKLSYEVKRSNRIDVVDMFSEFPLEKRCGFSLDIRGYEGRWLYLVMKTTDGRKNVYRIGTGKLQELEGKALKYTRKGMDYLKGHGVRALVEKIYTKVTDADEHAIDYNKWLKYHMPSAEELEKQKEHPFSVRPRFSIVVPLYKTNPEYLREMVDSVKSQTYPEWELCLSDGSGADSPLTPLLKELEAEDARIRTVMNEEALRISVNTNAAIRITSGDYLVFMDHDDVIPPNALYECAALLENHPETEVIYSDEDKTSLYGNRYFQPHFKPDFNPDLLCSVNYISHLFVVKKTLQEKVGLLRAEFDGSQDYDFILRCTEQTDKIRHIPKILYHWRCHEESTSENPESKLYAFEAGRRAIQAHYDRIGIKAEVLQGEQLGLYRTRFIRACDPLVSIIIPNMDHKEDLQRCISSIEEKSSYRNFEYIIVENNSREPETFAYYRALQEENPKVRVVTWESGFNFSALNNYGASFAKGEYLLLLNNDTMVINPDWLEELLGYGMRPDVGIVGARLYFGDDTIQHAGVVIGIGGMAGHCFVSFPKYDPGYFSRILTAQDYSAVTAACMLVRRSVFENVQGMTEELAVAFNDVDFCLKVRRAGFLVVYNPYAELYHFESKSRGLEDTPEKLERFHSEIAELERRWPKIFETPDPYYNPNLTLKSNDFALRRIFES